MDSLSCGHGAGGRRLVRPLVLVPVLILGLALLSAVAMPHGRAFAAGDPNAKGDAISPVEDFSRELDKLKKSFGEIGKKMDDSAKAIEGYTDVEKARKEIEDLRVSRPRTAPPCCANASARRSSKPRPAAARWRCCATSSYARTASPP